ncbi:hypothetical protein F5972_04940 [Microbispora cellulosiformans]|uniref:Secreted protein n=1 Tax=Microbispora cellulosiformans TaxID=2614688 RepID=A0A5J5K8Y4_9ACTN|nr:hypothetical protein [Microbispora cellulosiformans]KAA9380497.1 hypothetical protein F5972_04940 [Microbispora cellulosiformans]
MRRSAASVLATGALLFSGLAALAPTAAQAATCDVQIGKTYKSGSSIVGYGSLSDCPSASTATLIIQRWTGWYWKDYATATAHQGYDTYVYQNCSGTGTQTWRTLITGTTIGGSYRTKASNELRVSC